MKKNIYKLLLFLILSIGIPLMLPNNCFAKSIDFFDSMNIGGTISNHRKLNKGDNLSEDIFFSNYPSNWNLNNIKLKYIVDIKNVVFRDECFFYTSSIDLMINEEPIIPDSYSFRSNSSFHKEGTIVTYPDSPLLHGPGIYLYVNDSIASFDYTITIKDESNYVTSLNNIPKKDKAEVGDEFLWDYDSSPNTANHSAIQWSSSNKKVATVNKKGLVTAKKIGKTTITAKLHNGKKYNCTLTVVKASPRLKYSSYNLICGNSFKNKLYNVGKKVTWSSTNKKIATVSSNGTVKGKKAGTCYIKAKCNGKTYKCKVKVSYQKPSFYAELFSYDTRGNFFTVKFKNNGKSPLKIHSAKAYSQHFNYKVWDRKLYLPKNKDIVIKPGATKYVDFKVKGDFTAFDSDEHEIYFYFTYSGKKYLGYTEAKRSSYKNGKKWVWSFDNLDKYLDWL